MKWVGREECPRRANTIFGKTTKKNPLLDWSQIKSVMEFTNFFVDLMSLKVSFVRIFTYKISHHLSTITELVFCRKYKLVLLYLGQPACVFTLEIDSYFQFLVRHYLRQNKQFYMICEIYRITFMFTHIEVV